MDMHKPDPLTLESVLEADPEASAAPPDPHNDAPVLLDHRLVHV